MDILPCPKCGRETDYRYTDTDQNVRRYFYKCKSDTCRNHFCAVRLSGVPLQIVSQSPLEHKNKNNPAIGLMGCPGCSAYGKVKTSHKRPDGYWRRHQCLTCDRAYYTCEYEGGITVHQRLKSLVPIDN